MRKFQHMAKHVRLYVLTAWGIVSFLLLAGEPVDESMPLGDFFLYKLLAVVSLGLCVLAGKILYGKNLLPNMNNEKEIGS